MQAAMKTGHFSATTLIYLALCCLFTACASQGTNLTTSSKITVNPVKQTTPITMSNTSVHSMTISVPQKPDARKTSQPKPPTPTPQLSISPTQIPTTAATGGITSGKETAQEQQLVLQLFALINQDRANAGLAPLTWSPILASTAYNHSTLMLAGCGIAHQCSGEPAPCQRIANAGLNDPACGENIGNGAATPTLWAGLQQIDVSMLNEPEPAFHRRNILSTTHHHIGIGIRISASGQTWMTEDFTDL